MTNIETFLILLRAGLGKEIHTDLDFSNCDWKDIESLAIKQGVLPILFDGYQRLYKQCRIEVPVDIKLCWYAAAQQAGKHYNKHLLAIKTLSDFLAEHGIKTMVLKGYSLSLCYPKPSNRACGDIDIYCFGDYKKVDELISDILHCKVDKSHHHHTLFQWNGISVENHYDFFNVYAHRSSAWLDKVLKQLAEEPCEKVENVYIPSPNLHALFLIRHSSAHFAGERITFRHLLDWYFFCEKHGDEVNWKYIEDCSEKAGCLEFLHCLRICVNRLVGKDYEKNEKADRMWNDILKPEFEEKEPSGWRRIPFKAQRWWAHRWKHKIVYKENLAEQLLSLTYSHIIKPSV